MSLIQQRRWVLPKQKAWLHSPPLHRVVVAHTSCLSSHWQALRRAAAQTGSNQPSGFACPWGCSSQPARRLLFPPSPTSSENPGSQMSPSIAVRAASRLWLFWGRWLVSPGERLIASRWWHDGEGRRGSRAQGIAPARWEWQTQPLHLSSLDSGLSSLRSKENLLL